MKRLILILAITAAGCGKKDKDNNNETGTFAVMQGVYLHCSMRLRDVGCGNPLANTELRPRHFYDHMCYRDYRICINQEQRRRHGL